MIDSTQLLDADTASIIARWWQDWRAMSWKAKLLLSLFTCALSVVTAFAAWVYLPIGASAEFERVLATMAAFFALSVVAPFRIAWAMKRRGGRFDLWLMYSVLLGAHITGIFYLFRWAFTPKLVE